MCSPLANHSKARTNGFCVDGNVNGKSQYGLKMLAHLSKSLLFHSVPCACVLVLLFDEIVQLNYGLMPIVNGNGNGDAHRVLCAK